MIFEDRLEAAELLVEKLAHYKGQNPLVLAVPRGAIAMASMIAKGLQGELSVVLVHKIPSPFSEELAIASIGLSGHIHKLSSIANYAVSDSYLEKEANRQLEVLKIRSKRYGIQELKIKDRLVIIVDDGIATGATVMAAIHEVRSQHPKKVIVAAGVTARDSANKIRQLADELVVLLEPDDFYAVGQFYRNFPQVSDEEVIRELKDFK